MKKSIIVFLSFLIACSEPIIYRVEPDFVYYVDLFLVEAQDRGFDYSDKNIILEFGSLDGYSGITHHLRDGDFQIVIDSITWKSYNEIEREVLIFHELGHGILDRRHYEDCLSLMSTHTCKYTNYSDNRSEMLNELFNY